MAAAKAKKAFVCIPPTKHVEEAAPMIISTGEAMMAMGGFHGLDLILSTEKLARMVEANHIRLVSP